MNNHQKSVSRDFLTVETIKEWGALDTDQARILLFPSYRVAQRRLQKLVEQKRIKRCDQTYPYSYYLEAQTNILETINKNWVRLYIMKSLKSWEKLESYDYDSYTVLNTVTGKKKIELVKEMDIEKIRSELKNA